MKAVTFLLLLGCLCSRAQDKQSLLDLYFLRIPVTAGIVDSKKFLDSSGAFSFDSVQQNRGVFYTYKRQDSLINHHSRQPIVLLQRQLWKDSVTQKIFDSAVIVSVQYFFEKGDKTERDKFFKHITRGFNRHYTFSTSRAFSGKNKGEVQQFTIGMYDNYAQLQVFKGYGNELYYVTVRYDKRIHYQVQEPTISMQILSF